MANLPGSLPTKPAAILDFQPILASHVSTLWDEVVAIATMLGGSYSNPITVSDAASVPTPTDIGMILDAIAYVLKNITGQSTWNDVPVKTIAQLNTSITNAASNGAVIRLGTNAGKPAAASVTTNTLYYATDTKQFYYSNGSAWINIANYYDSSGNTDKALLKYNASTGQFVSLEMPNQDGSVLQAIWNSGTSSYDYKWRTGGIGYLISQYVTVYDTVADTFTPYTTIAQACLAATANQIVIVPAGVWTESSLIIVREQVQLVELQPDSVTISGRIKVAPGGYVRINKLIWVATSTEHYAIKIDESAMVGSTEYDTYVNIKLIQISGNNYQPWPIEIRYDLTSAVTCYINIGRIELTAQTLATYSALFYYDNAVSNTGIFEVVFGTVAVKNYNDSFIWRCNSAINTAHVMTLTARYIKFVTSSSTGTGNVFYNKNAGLGTYTLNISEELKFNRFDGSDYIFKEITVNAKRVTLDSGYYLALGKSVTLTIETFEIKNISWLSNPYGNDAVFDGCTINFTNFLITNGSSIASSTISIFFNCDVICENIIFTALATSSSYTITLFYCASGTHYFYRNSFLQYISTDDTKFIIVNAAGGNCWIGNICAPPNKVLTSGNVKLLNSSPYANPQFMAASLYLLRNFI